MIIYSRTALAQDDNGNLTRLKTIGNEKDSLKTFDTNVDEKLSEIVNQLKISTMHLSILTDNYIDEV